MDEENNQEQEERNLPEQALEAGKDMAKDTAKNAAKETGKEIGKKFAKFAKFAIKILLLIIKTILPILIAGIILTGIIYVIKDSITKISSTVSTVLKIGDNGPIAPTKEEMLDEIEEELKNMGISKTDLDMGNEAQADAYLYKFKMASLATELPYIAESPAKKLADIYLDVTGGILYDILDSIKGEPLQGIVKIKKRTDDGNTIDLKFKKYEDFKKLIESNDSSALNYFSIDDDWMLCVAKITTVSKYNVPNIEGMAQQSLESSTTTIKEVKIPYKTMIANYTIPFSFLMTLQQFTGCAEYVSAVCDLIMYDGEIELTVFESTQEMIVEENSTTVYNSKGFETKEVKNKNGQGVHYEREPYRNSQTVTENTKTVSKFTTITPDVTKADVWVYDREVTYKLNEQTSHPLGEDGVTTTQNQPEPEGEIGSWTEYTCTTKETDITKTWVQEDSKMEIEPDKFLGLWRNALGSYDRTLKLPFKRDGIDVKYGIPFISERKRPTENLFSAKAMFYDILERNEETQLHGKIMKELINYYLDESYKINVDFSVFDTTGYSSVTSMYGSNFEEKVWFALKDAGYNEYAIAGAMGNFKKESGIVANNVENITNQKSGLSDEQFTEQVNNKIISKEKFLNCPEWGEGNTGAYGYGLAQWTYITRKQKLYNLTIESGLSIDDEDAQITLLLKELSTSYTAYHLEQDNISSATENFMRIFENPDLSVAALSERIKYANEIYAKYQGKEKPQGGEFYSIAKKLHDYVRENQYWYPSAQNLAAGKYVSDGKSQKHKIPTIGEPENQRYIDCSAYVSWVISEYTGKKQIYGSSELLKNPMGFQQVNFGNLQPGDILVKAGHTEIYAGNGKTLNCGTTSAIRSEYSNYSANFTKAFRAPNQEKENEEED